MLQRKPGFYRSSTAAIYRSMCSNYILLYLRVIL
nr:MAG TPA: hypothetical protein [Caudoviricetes sp.]